MPTPSVGSFFALVLLAYKNIIIGMSGKILADYLKQIGGVKSPQIYKAFAAVDRAKFVPAQFSLHTYEDSALPIGYGQTISQPYTVAFMLELLEPQLAQKILDVGSGSGWTTALLAHIVGLSGKIYGVELVPQLVKMSQTNLSKLNIKNAEVRQAKQNEIGLPAAAPYDRILVSAAGADIVQELVDQLKAPGILVQPARSSIIKVSKSDDGTTTRQEYPGFAFVPLIGA